MKAELKCTVCGTELTCTVEAGEFLIFKESLEAWIEIHKDCPERKKKEEDSDFDKNFFPKRGEYILVHEIDKYFKVIDTAPDTFSYVSKEGTTETVDRIEMQLALQKKDIVVIRNNDLLYDIIKSFREYKRPPRDVAPVTREKRVKKASKGAAKKNC